MRAKCNKNAEGLYLDGNLGTLEKEFVGPQRVFEAQQLHIGTKGHFTHAVCMEFILVLYYF